MFVGIKPVQNVKLKVYSCLLGEKVDVAGIKMHVAGTKVDVSKTHSFDQQSTLSHYLFDRRLFRHDLRSNVRNDFRTVQTATFS